MKKLGILLILVCFLFTSCAVLKTINGYVCNPTPVQQETAAAMLAVIDAGQAYLATMFPGADIILASTVLKSIKTGGCFLVSELNTAFNLVDAANTEALVSQQKMMGVYRTGQPVVIPQYPALRAFIK